MANNLIQIKRSINTAQPVSLANGELAYTANGDVLFVGSNGTIKAIGGARSPGVLTANQALVVNSTSWMDSVKTANLVTEKIYANGEFGTLGYVLTSGGSGSNAYWVSAGTLSVTPGGSNTQVQFNDSGVLAASAGFSFNKDSNTLSVSNTISVGNSTVNTVVNSTSVTTGTITATTAALTNAAITKIYANSAHGTAGQILHSNSTGGLYWSGASSSVNNLDDLGDVAVATPSAGQILVSNSTGVFRNVSLSGDITVDAAGVVSIAADSVVLGTDTTGNYVATITAGIGLSGNATTEGSSPTIYVVANNGLLTNSSGVFVLAGTGVVSNATGVHIGQPVGTTDNVTFNDVTVNGNAAFGNATTDIISFIGRVNTSIIPSANITYDLGSTTSRWKDLYLSGSTILLGDTTLNDVAGVLTIGNTSTGDLSVTGNTTIGSDGSDVISFNSLVSSNFVPSANITYRLGNNTTRWLEVHAQNVHSEYLYIDKDVTIGGNLNVSGNLVTVNVSTLSVTDSMIQLAANNTLTDAIDIGFFGSYNSDGGDHEHTGLFRDASDDKYKLFKGLLPSPTTTVDISNNTYQTATLQAYLDSGGLLTNSTSVAVTANSTVAVTITANSLSLTTALAGGSGGTGLKTYTAEDILVANSSNGFRKLSLGADGYVLQSNGTALVYGTLDGGTF